LPGRQIEFFLDENRDRQKRNRYTDKNYLSFKASAVMMMVMMAVPVIVVAVGSVAAFVMMLVSAFALVVFAAALGFVMIFV